MSEQAAATAAPAAPAAPARPAAKPAAPTKPTEPMTIPQAIERIRQDQAKAREENRLKAAAQAGVYRVTLGDLKGDYKARNEAEAWALFNDAHKTSYGPKHPGRKIERIS